MVCPCNRVNPVHTVGSAVKRLEFWIVPDAVIRCGINTGVPPSQEAPPPQDPTVAQRLGTSGDPWGGGGGLMSEVPLQARGTQPRPLGRLGFECSQHRQTLRPSVDGIRSKALRPFGSQ
jgi:hypothetical protein